MKIARFKQEIRLKKTTTIKKKLLSLEELFINVGPKIFAARIGLVFSVVILFASATEMHFTALAFAFVLGLFSFLEAAFGICVACKIYHFLYRLIYNTILR